MSPTSSGKKSSRILGWVATIILVAIAWFIWAERQMVVDTVQYYQYQPTENIEQITEKLQLTDQAKFLFYASHPSLETSSTFNNFCKRQEANSPILGCYAQMRIHIYTITDPRLDGIEEVTAAHELLHAHYDRLSETKKQELEPLLRQAYDTYATAELRKRMQYYERTQPGEMYNELHSILPTEFDTVGEELEEYYAQYFNDRKSITKLHTKVSTQFTQLSQEADALVEAINALAISVNANTQEYNSGVASLNQRVSRFNQRATSPGGFSSQAQFNAERSNLEAERNRLDTLRTRIKSDIEKHDQLVAELNSINAKTESLNESIDSVLSEEPEI